MIIVTGGAGFIGSNLVKGLNREGHTDILIVDNLSDGRKFKNMVECSFLDYIDKKDFLEKIIRNKFPRQTIEAIFHQGACTSTTEWNGQYLIENNYEYSKILLHYCMPRQIPFIYASSAAVYGTNTPCQENPLYEKPLTVYGYSKLLFDHYVRRYLPSVRSQLVGLRYFNVFGPNENHKGTMKSLIQHFYNELLEKGTITIFDKISGCAAGEQRRDFIHVSDVVDVLLWVFKNRIKNGIINVGTGHCESFNSIAEQLIDYYKCGEIYYTPIHPCLHESYQVATKADLSKLRSMGYSKNFKKISEAIREYLPMECFLAKRKVVYGEGVN